MRKVADQDLAGRFEFVVDPDAESTDWDRVVAKFLLAVVRRKKAARSAGTAAVVEFSQAPGRSEPER